MRALRVYYVKLLLSFMQRISRQIATSNYFNPVSSYVQMRFWIQYILQTVCSSTCTVHVHSVPSTLHPFLFWCTRALADKFNEVSNVTGVPIVYSISNFNQFSIVTILYRIA